MRCAVDCCPNERAAGHLCVSHCEAWKASGEYQRSLVPPYAEKSIQRAKADFCRRLAAEDRNGMGHAR